MASPNYTFASFVPPNLFIGIYIIYLLVSIPETSGAMGVITNSVFHSKYA